MNTGIYLIQSLIKPYRIYVGSAKNITRRWSKHLQDLRLNKHHSPQMQWHYNKYGEDDLLFSILEPCEAQELTNIEQYYLDKHKPYFNTCKTAGNTLGYKHSDESKKKISEAGRGNKYTLGREPWNKGLHGYKVKPSSEEKKRKISEANKGKQAGDKHPRYGKHCSEETKRKIKEAITGHIVTPETREKIRKTLLAK